MRVARVIPCLDVTNGRVVKGVNFVDLRDAGVKCSTIMPGSVATHFNNHEPNAADAWKIQPEDLGQMVVDLLRMNPRTLPSKIEVRPSMPGK